MMPMTLANPDGNTINSLREMMRLGLLTEDDLASLKVSNTIPEQGQSNNAPLGMFNAPNQLEPIIQGPQAGLNQWDKLQSGEGVIQSSNGDGSMNAPIRINKVPPPTWNPQAQGNAGIVQRPMGTEQTAAGAERDMSRPEVQLFGKAPGYYGKDGKVYHKDGTVTTIMPEGSLANFHAQQKRQMDMQKFESDQGHTQAQTALLKAQETNARLKPIGEKPPADMRYNDSGELEAIPNSKLDMKQKQQFATDKGALETVERTSKALIDNINQIIGDDVKMQEHPGLRGSVGYLDAKLPPLTTAQANAQTLIKGLLDKTSVAGLQTLRQTGTAPGSITEKEWPIFQNYLGTINPAQGEDQYREQLKALRIGAQEMLTNTQRNFQERYANQAKGAESHTVRLPDGRVKTFPNAAAAAMFKKAAGL